FFQSLAGLNSRVIKLAPLADDDWAGADEQNLVEMGVLRHGRWQISGRSPNVKRGRGNPSGADPDGSYNPCHCPLRDFLRAPCAVCQDTIDIARVGFELRPT